MDRKKIILLIIFFTGLVTMLYPTICQYWNSKVQSRAIDDYKEMIPNIATSDYNNMFTEANDYNQKLFTLEFPLIQYPKVPNYKELININNKGMIGYITIDKLKVELPIYHGTSSSILNIAVGHLQGSSLPIGGPNTHSVLSAHRGLPSAQLFTNLDKLEIGDTFIITILNKNLTYQVDKISIVEPTDVSTLAIIEGKDYVTLMTCTPYGVNSHRLLVRGVRIPNEEAEKILRVSADAQKVDNMIVMPFMAFPLFLILVFVWAFGGKKKTRTELDYDLEFNDK